MSAQAPQALRPEHPIARSLSGLASDFALDHVGSIDDVEVSGVSLSSTDIAPGDLYVGVKGRFAHGASFADAARDSGAVAVLTDPEGAELAASSGLPVLLTADPRAALGDVSAWIYRTGDHAPTMFAVTGTNGKTSVVYLLDGILRQLGVVTGLTSTAERRIGAVSIASRLTTPEASELHGLLARMREAEVRAVSIEVSAQALSRHRVDGLVFDVAGFINLSHDHLDDYADMEEYFRAKLALFDPDRARRGVVSLDSEWGERIVAESRIPVVTVSATPGTAADWTVRVLAEEAEYTEFELSGPDGRSLVTRVPVLGWFMAANAALAIVMLVESGFDIGAIAHVLDRDGGIDAFIPGRAERVSGSSGPTFYVDYGHTPDAFLQTLLAIRKFTPGRIFMVFGADGDRDTTKRVDMGEIAAHNADVVIVTDYHPRFEDPAEIRAVLVAAARAAVPDREVHEIADPSQAVRTAVSLAREGDTILVAGPGHEDYHEVAGVKIPYSARNDAREALREAGWE
ncbi:Mur ligase family protein [Planctomonas psychrotolerans]|uniref:Mur ligase family protein n=1 Tax=Planctomonas psychrotolerans TaxID=2528712 RepID=UPI001238E188|nr:UDP-N-acetylmuramoyl-L-alanyl-D-glutamate--2,6-diaminopimelate ligase [Planctomonas psychrotolerans]